MSRESRKAAWEAVKAMNWKAISLGTLDFILLTLLSLGLVGSVAHQFWIVAQICLLGILLLLSVAGWQVHRLLLDRAAQKPREDLGTKTIVWLVQFTACGVAAIIIYAIQYNHWNSEAVSQIAGVGLLTAGASLAAGALLGFIFGVPKSQGSPSPATPEKSTTGSASSASSGGQQFGANTNLEQISDWLTKTIVGVSLVELSKLPPLFDKLAWYVAAGMGDAGPAAKAVALVIMIYFASTGFLISYLWTRMELTREFSESLLDQRVRELEQQSAIDAKAIVDIDRWLNHHPANEQEEDKARTEMMADIKKSSSLTKARVFVTAEDYKRSKTAETVKAAMDAAMAAKDAQDAKAAADARATKAAADAANAPGDLQAKEAAKAAQDAKIAADTRAATAADDAAKAKEAARSKINEASVLTLPIFQALVEADDTEIFHRNRSQYAFSLMTLEKPDWRKALDTLKVAIKVRDRSKEPGWTEYEFAQAVCRIKLEPQVKPGVNSDIDAALKKAKDANLDLDKRERLDLDDVTKPWMT